MWLNLANVKVFREIQDFPVVIGVVYEHQLQTDDAVLIYNTHSDLLLVVLSMAEKGVLRSFTILKNLLR